MKINTFLAVAVSSLAILGSGCVGTNDGHSHGGFPVKDRIEARYPRSVEQVAEATLTVLKRDGKVLVDNVVDNTFKAKINERDVYVRVTKMDDKITLLQVQARTSMGGDIYLAAQLDKEIALELTKVSP